MKKTLILDVDGVLRDIVSRTMEIYRRDIEPGNNTRYDEIDTYDMRVLPKLGNTRQFFSGKYARDIFCDSFPYEHNIGMIVQDLSRKYNIHIVTNQFLGNENYTLKWLNKYNIKYDAITFTADKSLVTGDVMVDDYWKNLESFNGRRILFHQPYNKNYNFERIKSLKELIE